MSDTKISDRKIATMLVGLNGVTPGPWFTTGAPWFRSEDGVLAGSPDGNIAYLIADCDDGMNPRIEYVEGGGPFKLGDKDADAAHIARCDPDTIRSILTELQSLRSKPVAGVEVKPLEWGSKHEDATGYLSYDAKSVLGTYSIYRIKNGGVWSCERGVVNIGQFSSETEAKAAAEADYRQRILSTLSLPAQVPVSFEGLPKRKLDDLVGRGWQVVGYALQNGEQRYGFITTGGFVGWWLPEDYPLHTSGEPPQPEAVITEEMVGRARKRVDEVLDEHGTMSFVQAHGWIGLRKVVSEALTAALKEA